MGEDTTRSQTSVLHTIEREPIPLRGPAAYVAEFLGTFLLVLFITSTLSLYLREPIDNGPNVPQTLPFVDFSVIGLVQLFLLCFLIQTLAVVSGAHFNPAITAALAAVRQIRLADAGIYVICQLAGGVLGALVTRLLFQNEGDPFSYGAPSYHNLVADGKVSIGLAAEVIGTFVLVWAVMGAAVHPGGLRDWSGLVIGGTLGFAVMVLGPVSGGSFNPARAFGPALVGGFGAGAGKWLLVYVLGPLIGALLAAVSYQVMFILPGRKGLGGMDPVG
ncbi:MAG: glycerol uptake facilitator protein [Thermoleophilaceae bacterium]|nr:glycerol uptake facilitator protein [Thermoleophilaceae bacterium]